MHINAYCGFYAIKIIWQNNIWRFDKMLNKYLCIIARHNVIYSMQSNRINNLKEIISNSIFCNIVYKIEKYLRHVFTIFLVNRNVMGQSSLNIFPRWKRYMITCGAGKLHEISHAEGTYKVKTRVARQQVGREWRSFYKLK